MTRTARSFEVFALTARSGLALVRRIPERLRNFPAKPDADRNRTSHSQTVRGIQQSLVNQCGCYANAALTVTTEAAPAPCTESVPDTLRQCGRKVNHHASQWIES